MAKNTKFDQPSNDDIESIKKTWVIPYKDLITPPYQSANIRSRQRTIDYDKIRNLVIEHADSLDDAEGILELLPDLELVIESGCANILSPKDLMNLELSIKVDKAAPPEFAQLILAHFTNVYNLEENIPTILKEALYTKGSYILFSIPPLVISNIITKNTYGLEQIETVNNSYSIIKTLKLPTVGFIKSKNSNINYMMESLSSEIIKHDKTETIKHNEIIEITDNLGYLALPSILKTLEKKQLKSTLNVAYGIEEILDETKINNVYKNNTVSNIPVLDISFSTIENTEFNPIVLKLPAEAVIPIHIPGEPENHIGYYLFLDEYGNPLHYSRTSNKFKQLNDKLNQTLARNTEMVSVGLGVSYPNSASNSNEEKIQIQKTLLEEYNQVFERQLLEAIQDNKNKIGVEISNPGELYRIMFARQLTKQFTRVLYIPAELISYIAFNYDQSGIGISLLEKSKLYASFRAILMFATVIAGVNSSINRRTLTLTLDPDDPDQKGTVEEVINEYVALQASGSAPVGRLNPLDIVDFLQKSGIQLKINGGDRFPGTDINIDETKREITPPNTDIMDMLKDAHYAALWTSRDTIEHSNDLEFATTITSANLLQAKRAAKCQKILVNGVSRFIQQYIYTGGPLYNELKQKYEEVKTEDSLSFNGCIQSIKIHLPTPDTSILETQFKDYQTFTQFLEGVIDIYIADDMLGNLTNGENVTNNLPAIKAAVMNVMKRNYLRSENMLPELDQLITSEDSNINELIENHNEIIVKLVEDVLRQVRKVENKEDIKTQTVLDKLKPIGNTEEETNDENSEEPNENETEDETGDLGLPEDENLEGTEETPENSDESEETSINTKAETEEPSKDESEEETEEPKENTKETDEKENNNKK